MVDNISLDTIPKEKMIVDFWAEWCGPCRQMAPYYETISEEIKEIKFTKVNIETDPDSAKKFNITSIPTFLFFENGKEVHRIIGAKPPSHFRDEVLKFLTSEF